MNEVGTRAAEYTDDFKARPRRDLILEMVEKVIIEENTIIITFDRAGLQKLLGHSQSQIKDVEKLRTAPASITREYHLKPCQHGKKLVIRQNDRHETAQPDPSLIKVIARAQAWLEDLKKGLSYKNIASRDKIDQRHVARAVRLAFLAPDITRAILSGQEPSGLTSQVLIRIPHLPADWNEQRNLLGFN